jgi:hypothetical protein
VTQDDFHALEESRHMLAWVGLGAEPYRDLRARFVETIRAQDPGSVLEWVRLVGEPEFLTGGLKTHDGGHVLLRRAGLAFAFELSVVAGDGQRWTLRGVATLAGARLDQPGRARFRFYFDLDAELEAMSETGFFASRLFALEEEADDPPS